MVKIFSAQSIDAENLEISQLIKGSINCAKEVSKGKEIKGFSEEEKSVMISMYFGKNNDSKYCKTVKSYLMSPNGFINVGTKEDLESVLMSLIVTHIGYKIGMTNYDALFGTGTREDLVAIVEDTFMRSLASYNLNRDTKLKEEIDKKVKDPNYEINFKFFKSFNAYIYKSVGRELLRHTKKPGKYGPDEQILEEYTEIDRDGNSQQVSKITEKKGPYIVDVTKAPIEMSLSGINGFIEDLDYAQGEVSDSFVFDNNPLVYNDTDLAGIFNQAHINELKRAYDEIFKNLSWEEKVLLRNFDDYCELYGEKKLKQREIAEILNVKQGTVSKNISNLCFKITNEIFRRGFLYNENSFS